MRYNYLEDLEGITDLKEIGGTATTSFTAFHGMRIRLSDDGERIFYQYVSDKGCEEIHEVDVEYFTAEPEVLDILNMDLDEFEEYYDGVTTGFRVGSEIYLLEEFIRDDY